MPRAGNYDYAVFPYTYVKCKDGYTFISGFTDPNFTALCEIMNRPDLREQFPTIKERLTLKISRRSSTKLKNSPLHYTSDEILDMVHMYSKREDKKGTVVTGGWRVLRKFWAGNTGRSGEPFSDGTTHIMANSWFRIPHSKPCRERPAG